MSPPAKSRPAAKRLFPAPGLRSFDLDQFRKWLKEAKVYVADLSSFRRLNSSETGEILSVVTNSGHEGNYTIGNRGLTANWLEWAKPALLGKNVIDLLPTITATTGTQETFGFSGGRSGGPGGGRVERMLLPAAGGRWPRRWASGQRRGVFDEVLFVIRGIGELLCEDPLPARVIQAAETAPTAASTALILWRGIRILRG
jgi:hypothetical protein